MKKGALKDNWTYSNKAVVLGVSTQNLFVILLGLLLLSYYLFNIQNIFTIWELDDEAQFLFNGSMLAGYDWKEVFSNLTTYYGYGYSILMIPLFFLCQTGLGLIRGAIVVNILCTLAVYFLQIYVMSKVLHSQNKKLLAVISMITCLYPYLVASSMKVMCESFLTLQVWVIAALLYKTVQTKKTRYYVLLSIATVYIFFIHTRSIATIASLGLVMAIFFLKCSKKEKGRVFAKYIVFLGVFLGAFCLLYAEKQEILQILGSGKLIKGNKEIANLVTGSFITDRLKWLFAKENVAIYLSCAIGKVFYLIVSSGGVIAFGLLAGGRDILEGLKAWKKDITAEKCIEYFLIVQSVLAFIMCSISGTGNTYEYFIYGRYYEYTVGVWVFLGIYSLIQTKQSRKKCLFLIAVIVMMGIITAGLSEFATNVGLRIDTNRYAGLSSYISGNEDWKTVIIFSAVVTIMVICIYMVLQRTTGRKIVLLLIVAASFLITDSDVLSEINKANETNIADMDMAEYIEKNVDGKEIYFIYETYRYDSYFTRMQVFLKNETVHVIYPEELKEIAEDAYIITYKKSPFSYEMKRNTEQEFIMESTHYELFFSGKSNR